LKNKAVYCLVFLSGYAKLYCGPFKYWRNFVDEKETIREEMSASPGEFIVARCDRWAFALCALASKKVVRDAILVADSYGICKMLERLEEGGIVKLHIVRDSMPEKGHRAVDFDDWVYQMNQWGAYAKEDRYEKGCLRVDLGAMSLLGEAIAEELSFAGEDKRDLISRMAKALGAEGPLSGLEKEMEEELRKVCAPEVNKPFLAVLIPVAHILNQGTSPYLPGIGSEITRHRNTCRYCRKFLQENGLLEPAA